MKNLLMFLFPLLFLSACTPDQLAVWQDYTGIELSQGDYDLAIAQPDDPILLPEGSQINADGSVTRTVRSEVNALSYAILDPNPAMLAFRMVALECDDPLDACLTEDWVNRWGSFSYSVMLRESKFCPNLRRGAVVSGPGCAFTKQGRHSDSGFAQVLMGYPNKPGWYKPIQGGTWKLHEHAGWACPKFGYCTPNDVVSEPYASMRVYIELLVRAGSGPWCFGDFRYTTLCRSAPDR
jgi:hypothetical protein